MGKIIKNGISYTTSSDVALNINYDNSTSGIAAGTVQAALDELAVGVNGILISVPAAGWVEGSESGTYTNTIEVLDLSGNIALDCYIENNATDEAKNFFDTKITLIETEDGLIIFTATEAYIEDFNVLLKGNVGAAGSGSGANIPTTADIVVELPLENWAAEEDGDYSQTVELEAVAADFNPIVLLSYEGEEPTDNELSSYACIKAINVSEGIIKFIASEKPVVTFSVIIKGIAADVTELKNHINKLEEKITELENTGGSGNNIIADSFNVENTYIVGDYCIYDNQLYKCITAIETAGEWNATYWEATTVSNEIEKVHTNLGSKIVYNEETDKLDVYIEGIVVGSISCRFQGYEILTSEGWKNGFSLGSVATMDNTLYTSDGACSYANYQITCAIPATNAHTRGSYINGVIPFANYSKAIATLLIDGVTEMTLELDLSSVTSNGYLAIFAHRNGSGVASCALKATSNNSGNYTELASKGTGAINSASKVVFTDIRLIYNK